MAAQLFVEALHDTGKGNAAGVGGENRAGAAHGGDAREQVAFDLQVFGHGFDDPLALAQAAEIVFEVAGRDEPGGGGGEKTYRPLFGGGVDAGEGGRIARGLAGDHDVQQVHGESGVGKVGGDARPHGPGAEDSDTTKWSHQR